MSKRVFTPLFGSRHGRRKARSAALRMARAERHSLGHIQTKIIAIIYLFILIMPLTLEYNYNPV